jgi:ubiquinone/menaquinone biosynthesis C-methylase UbiE
MKLTRLEKAFVNGRRQAENNIRIVERLFGQIDLDKVKDVLEVGCGIGVVAAHLVQRYGWNVTGIDLDSEQIERARNDNPENEHLKFLEADATGLPFEDREFDVVLSLNVLHHVPDWSAVLAEAGRVLRPEGLYVLYDFGLPGPRFAARIFKYAAFGADDIIDCLSRDAFEIVYAENPGAGIFTILPRQFSVVSRKAPADCL